MTAETPVDSDFGRRLGVIMSTRRMTGRDLSRQTGIEEALISKYKTGKHLPVDQWGNPSNNARRIADALGVDVSELFE